MEVNYKKEFVRDSRVIENKKLWETSRIQGSMAPYGVRCILEHIIIIWYKLNMHLYETHIS